MSYKPTKVMVLREAVTKVTQILAGRRIEVSQRGMEARVDYDKKTLLPVRVTLPMLPDNASDELCDAVQGFLDHEVAHVLFTDPHVVAESAKTLGGQGDSINNMVEDVYIERRMRSMFKGSGSNLERTCDFYLKSFVEPNLTKARAAGDLKAELSVMFPTIIRALGGQFIFKEALKRYASAPADKVYAKLEDLSTWAENIKDSRDGLELTKEILKRLKNDEAPPASPQPQDCDKKEEGEGSQPPSQDKKPNEGESNEGESDEGESDEGESNEGESNEGESNEGESDGEPEDGSNDGEPDGESDGEPEDGSNDGEPDGEPDSGQDEGEGSNSGESQDEGEGEGEGEGQDEGQDEGNKDSSAGDKQQQSEANVRDTSERDTPNEENAVVSEETEPDLDWADILAAAQDAKDFDDAAADSMADLAADALKSADYVPYTTEEDRIEILQVPQSVRESSIESCVKYIEEPVASMVAPMQKDLERAIAARSAAIYIGGHRSGRINSASLTRLKFGDDRVFRRKEENHTKDVAVQLVCDISGSMAGSPVLMAARAAFALASVLDRIQVKNEVICFTTGRLLLDHYAQSQAAAKGIFYSRLENIVMPILKTFDEKINSEVRARFGRMPHSMAMSCNIDGESIEYAARRLLARKAARHVMIVLSDGEPAGHTMNGRVSLDQDLKRRVKRLEAAGIDIVGIGIESTAPRRYYPKHVVINDINELPGTVMKQLRGLLVPR